MTFSDTITPIPFTRFTYYWNIGSKETDVFISSLAKRTSFFVDKNVSDLLVDDGRDRQTVETVRERLPQLDVVTTFACKKKRKQKNEFFFDKTNILISPLSHSKKYRYFARDIGIIYFCYR